MCGSAMRCMLRGGRGPGAYVWTKSEFKNSTGSVVIGVRWACVWPSPCSASLGPFALLRDSLIELSGGLHQDSQRLIDRLRVAKYCGHIGVKQDNVSPFHVLLVILAANAASQIIFRPHLIFIGRIILQTHTGPFPAL